MSRYVYEPGNGTRYELFITPFVGSLLGCSGSVWVVAGPFPDKVRAMVLPVDIGLHWTYVAEKMGLNEVDASVVALMVGRVTGVTAWPTKEPGFAARISVPFEPEVPCTCARCAKYEGCPHLTRSESRICDACSAGGPHGGF